VVKVLLCGCLVLVGEDMSIQTIHSPWRGRSFLCCLSFETWLLLRWDKGSERETKYIATFVWHTAKKFDDKKWHQNNLGSNGRDETSPDSLLLTIKVIYIILKKQIVEKLTSQVRNTHDLHQVLLWYETNQQDRGTLTDENYSFDSVVRNGYLYETF
jgi:hypothetical protein